MIVDCFMFFNEYNILEGRLEYLYDTVDYFVIVETDRTHNGALKPLNYALHLERYSKYQDKILYFPYSTDVSKYNWQLQETAMKMDNDQRNYIATALKLFDTNDTVMISDLDEIPDKDNIEYAINNLSTHEAVVFAQEMFFYNLNQRQNQLWPGTIISTVKQFRDKTPQYFRDIRWNLPAMTNGGWHLTYWNNLDGIQFKMKNFAHQEYNSEQYTNKDRILARIKAGRDPYDREDFVPVDRTSLQQDFLKVFEKYEPREL